MTLYNCDDSYLLVPCWGRGCTGGCPCGRGAATRGAPSTGTETAATRPGSAGRTVSNTKWIKRTRHIAQWHNHMYIILITPESPVPRSRSPDTVMSRHERRGAQTFTLHCAERYYPHWQPGKTLLVILYFRFWQKCAIYCIDINHHWG